MIRALAVLSVLAGAIAMPVQAAPRPATIGTAATVDFRVVLTARRISAGDAPTAAVTATIYRLGRDSWERTGSRVVPGTYFWNVVGPLPAAKVTTVKTTRGQLVSIALPTRGGYVWRVARPIAARIVRQVGEGDVGRVVVLVFAAVGRGHASIVLAETRGETARAYRAVRYEVTVA